ncbi:hypothetical protein ACFVTM_23000 [Arthrobacter sp. NPDC058130]|uniref:hypothetical protein n=1 Tax=Arthrobacter sp. NPDC058130 TaxID=3346353 RepID=UPI0036E0ADCA
MNKADERTETNLDKIGCPGREQKLQTTIEGWSVGILGAIAIVATIYASFQYSGW